MGRARVTLKRIINPRGRKLAFMQRRKGLMKKIKEFSTMCGAEACLIVYDDGNGDVGPMTWPEDRTVVGSIIRRYQNQKKETHPKTFHIEEFFDSRKSMVEAEISKLQKEIIKIKYPTWDSSFKDMGEEQLRSFIAMLGSKIRACDHRINMLKNMHHRTSMPNMAPESVSSSHPSQFNFMQNITQSQLMNAPMSPFNGSNMMVGLTNSTNVIDGAQSLRINILKSMQQGDTHFNFMPNMVQGSVASPNLTQLNCKQNIFPSQPILPPMDSTNLIDGAPNHKNHILKSMRSGDACNSIMPNMVHEGATSSSSAQFNCIQNISQSHHIHATSKSLNDNNEQVSSTNQQLCESKDLANPVNGVDDLDELFNQLDDDIMGRTNQFTESIWQDIPFQHENEQQETTLQALSPPQDQFPTDYHNMLF